MNLTWAKSWMDGLNSKEGVERTLAMYADEVEFEDLTLGHKANGKAELRNFFGGLFAPGAGKNVFTVTAFSGGADGGAAEWTWRAKHEADFMGTPAAGKQTEARGVSILTFREGKIKSQHDYWDSGAVLHQLAAPK